MIVFISDLHVGANVPLLASVEQGMSKLQRDLAPLQMQLSAGAVEGFYADLTRLAQDAGARKVTLVLLGDIFDFIQTRVWLSRNTGQSPAWASRDPDEGQVMDVLDHIVRDNRALFRAIAGRNCLSFLDVQGKQQEIPLERVYVPGNHDRLCNKYPRARRFVDEALGLRRPLAEADFTWEFHDTDHRVFGRHGHVFDEENYAGTAAFTDDGHLRTPIGDLLTTEIASTLPDRVAATLDRLRHPPSATIKAELKRDLEAMFSVPGLGTIKWFSKRIIGRWRGGKVLWASIVALATLTWGFARQCLERPRWFGRSWGQNTTWSLRATIGIPALLGLLTVAGVAAWHGWALLHGPHSVLAPWLVAALVAAVALPAILWWPVFCRNPDSWLERGAGREAQQLNRENPGCIRCIVYGHTHNALQKLLTVASGGSPVHYLNSGTWRQIIDLAADDSEFASHKSLTYVAVYADAEQETRSRNGRSRQYFECWTGALRDDECF